MVTNLSINKDLSKNIIPYQYFIGTNNQELPKTPFQLELRNNEKNIINTLGQKKELTMLR